MFCARWPRNDLRNDALPPLRCALALRCKSGMLLFIASCRFCAINAVLFCISSPDHIHIKTHEFQANAEKCAKLHGFALCKQLRLAVGMSHVHSCSHLRIAISKKKVATMLSCHFGSASPRFLVVSHSVMEEFDNRGSPSMRRVVAIVIASFLS